MSNSNGTGMRRASGIVFGVLSLFGLFLMSGYTQYAGLSTAPIGIIIEYVAIFAFAGIAIKLISGTGEVSSSARITLICVTVLYFVFNLLTFDLQKTGISLTWGLLVEGEAALTTQQEYIVMSVVFLVIKFILAVVGVFLASMSVSEESKKEIVFASSMPPVEEVEIEVEIDEDDTDK